MWQPKALYSQNYEDLYLWRLFKEIDCGFYIDIGAWDPEIDSVTKIFYDQGWHGVNVEPVEFYWKRLSCSRRRDINLQVAISSSENVGEAMMNIYPGSGLSSLDRHIHSSELHANTNLQNSLARELVQVITLREIIDANCVSPIDFLKIDVEGEDLNVLTGLELPSLPSFLRPKLILLEVTRINSPINSHSRPLCRQLLEDNGYCHIFFDGLNDYYCDRPYRDVYAPKMLPPNVFDPLAVHCSALYADRKRNEDLTVNNSSLTNSLQEREGVVRSHKYKYDHAYLQLCLAQDDLKKYILRWGEQEIQLADLKSIMLRQQSKLDWLRTQRKTLLRLLHLQAATISHFSMVLSRLLIRP